MRQGDVQKGTPFQEYKDTKANITALTGVPEGAIAYATDTNELGSYDGATWTWGQGGSLSAQDEGIYLGGISTLNVVGLNADFSVSGTVGRLFVTGSAAGTSDHEALTGLLGGSANNHWHLTPSQNTGLVSGSVTDLHYHAVSSSTGIITGGLLSIGSPTTTFSISNGTGMVVNNTVTPATVTQISWTGKTNITATHIAAGLVSYVGIDSGGNVVQQLAAFTNIQTRSIIVIGSLIHVNLTVIDAINQFGDIVISPANQLADLEKALGRFNISGNIFSANGANLNLNKSVGTVFSQGSNLATSYADPNTVTLASLTALSFQYRFSTGTNGATGIAFNPNIYDVAGVSTAVPSNKFTVQRVYSFVSNNVKIQPGQTIYQSLSEAKAAIQTQVFVTEPSISANGILRGFIVVREGTTALNSATDVFFYEAGKFSQAVGIGGQSVSSLQNAYDNSSSPEILTDATRGAVSVRRGSGADTDNVIEGLNNASSITFSVTGAGVVAGSNLSGTNTGDQDLSYFVNATGTNYVDLTDGGTTTLHSHNSIIMTGTILHESLSDLYGGSANNHWHLTSGQFAGLVSGSSTILHSHTGTTLYNSEFGYIINQTATESGETRTARSGLISNGTNGEQLHQIFEPGGIVTVPNGDFASLDMTSWTEAQKGSVSTALGTLSTVFTVWALCFDSAGNLYAGGGSFTTSSVWKYDISTGIWAAHGVLDPTFDIYALAIDSNGLLYAGGRTTALGAAIVYEYTSGAWSLVTTIDASGTVLALSVDSSNNCFAGGSGFATSAVYKRTAGAGAFSAHGTLDPTKNCRALKFDSTGKLIAGGNFATSNVWSVASGSTTWGAVSTLTATTDVYALAIKSNDDIVAGGSASGVYLYSAGAWTQLGTLTSFTLSLVIDSSDNIYAGGNIGTNEIMRYEAGVSDNDADSWRPVNGTKFSGNIIYAMVISGSNLYCGDLLTTSSVWKVAISNWSGTTGKATGNTDSNQSAILINAARYAVTAGTYYDFGVESAAVVSSGTATVQMDVKFYTASTAGSLVSTVNIGTRTGASLSTITTNKLIIAPATATHAIFFTTITTTGATTYTLDNFTVAASSVPVEIKLNDAGVAITAPATTLSGTLAVSGNGFVNTVAKAADETVNNSTTLQDDNHLLFAVAINSVYKFSGLLLITAANSTMDMKINWSLPAAATIAWGTPGGVTSSTSQVTGASTPATVISSADLTQGTGGTTFMTMFTGFITTGATSGTVTMQWAQNTLSAADLVVKKGSVLEYIKVV